MTRTSLFAAITLMAMPALAAAECAVDFDTQVQRSLDRRCVACHNDASLGGGLSLARGEAYDNLVNIASTGLPTMPLVSGGDLDNSYLYHKLAGTHAEVGGNGERMPFGGELSEADMVLFADWITACVPAAG